jgi:regulator of RNase E activity RraA
MRADPGGAAGVPVSELHQAIAATSGPVVVVIEDENDPSGLGAFLGEVNGTLLAALHVSGFLTNGRVRDVTELRTLNFAVHAAGLCVARRNMRLTAVGIPVIVGGLAISPGDLLHGDQHGVLKIPEDTAAQLPALAARIRDEEQAIVKWARSAEFAIDGLLALRRGNS